jgi:hypothetical protein
MHMKAKRIARISDDNKTQADRLKIETSPIRRLLAYARHARRISQQATGRWYAFEKRAA